MILSVHTPETFLFLSNTPFTYFCYRVKFCVKSYSMVGMIA